MGNRMDPIHVDRAALTRSADRIADAAEETGRLIDELEGVYFLNRTRMGQTDDLALTDTRYEQDLQGLRDLQAAMEDYASRLRNIRDLYRKAQEESILKAMEIHK